MLSTMQDAPLSLAQLLRYGSTVHGASAVSTWTGSESRTEEYAAVGRRAAQLAHGLRGLGVAGDERVATFMWNNNEHLEAYLAVPAMGAVLHTLNVRLFPDQLTFIANHAEDRIVIVDATLAPLLAKNLPQMRTVRHVLVKGDASVVEAPDGVEVHSYDELLAGQPEEFDWPEVDERSAAAMCYTSGTTGDPKGVAYSHRSIWLHSMQVCMSDGLGISQRDRILVVVPQFHAMAWGIPYGAFMVGASLVMPDQFLQPEHIVRMLAAERPTMAGAVPTVWTSLLQHLESHPQDISHLDQVVCGGSAVPPALMHAFHDQHGVQVIQAWGMTETSPLASVARAPATAAVDDAWRYRYTQGRLVASVRGRLVSDAGEVLPWDASSVGELEVAGPWVTGCYNGGADPEKFHDGWLRTGDVGHLTPDGFLTLTDRAKDVIKSGGEWISSVELENAVMAHPAVAEAAVIGVPDEKWDERPLVAVVPAQGEQISAAELREFLIDKVAKWQLPDYWAFVDEIPKTSVGKFDKKQLRTDHSQGRLNLSRAT